MPNRMIPVIQQRLKGDAESICFKCFHRKVCRAIDNQPCIECNQFTDANGVTIATDNNVGHKWIPVTERLPKEFEDILVCSGGAVEPGWLGCDGVFYSYDKYEADTIYDVTHWMPLPEAPIRRKTI